MRKTIITLACCAFIAPMAFAAGTTVRCDSGRRAAICANCARRESGAAVPLSHLMGDLPHSVQLSDSPHGNARSVMIRDLPPRPAMFRVPAPSMCQQTRTQRVQRMQRLWSMPKSACVLSTFHFGEQYSYPT